MEAENKDLFKSYFENEEKSGGGDVAEIEFRSTDNVFIVTFQEEIVARRVVKRSCHRFLKNDLYVELVKPSKSTKLTASPQDIKNRDTKPNVLKSLKFDKTQTELLVEDIPTDVDEDELDNIFSSHKLRSCTVEHIDYDEREMNAVIRFKSPEDVKTVLKCRPIKIKQKEVSVKIYVPKKPNMIRVRGPAEIMKAENEDRFEAYFANKKKSGGGDIAGIEFRSTDDSCIVTFQDDIVARRVAERRGHRLIGKDIEVELLIPSRSTKTTLSEKSNIIKEGRLTEYRNLDVNVKTKPVTTLKVSGVKKVSNRESVQWYFENKNKAGGGDIEQRYTDDEDEDIIYIQYKDESVAQAVARREHTIEGHTLEVTLNTGLVSPPSYQNKLLIKGLNPKTTLDVLALYIESKTKLCLLKDQLTYHIDNKDTILVTVNGEIDIQKLQDACKKAPLDGSSLNIRQVPVSNTVLVSNISEIVTEDMITLYFENLQRSNGGPVEKVAMFVNQNYCLVHFVDYNTVDNVLSKEQTLCDRRLEVKRYFQCIGRAEGDTVDRRLEKKTNKLFDY